MPINIPKQGLSLARALVEHFEQCEKLNGLEQAAAESVAQITGNRVTAAEIVGNAKDEARAIMAKADEIRKAADMSMADAKLQSAAIIADANAEAEQTKAKALEAAKLAKGREDASEEAERKANANLEAMIKRISDLEIQLADATAVIAKAEAIKRAMG
jgi:membrane protein involved in colicin uptake